MATASHTNPCSNATEAWNAARARLEEADRAFVPVQKAFNVAERAWFDVRKQHPGRAESELANLPEKELFDAASAAEHLYGNALYEAAKAMYLTPAPDLFALIEKVERIEMIGYDGNIEPLILADLRRLTGYPPPS